MGNMLEAQGLCHRSGKYPWLILALSILGGPVGLMVNSYQAEGGACFKTFFAGFILLHVMWISYGTVLLALLGLIVHVLAILHGLQVMKISKATP